MVKSNLTQVVFEVLKLKKKKKFWTVILFC